MFEFSSLHLVSALLKLLHLTWSLCTDMESLSHLIDLFSSMTNSESVLEFYCIFEKLES